MFGIKSRVEHPIMDDVIKEFKRLSKLDPTEQRRKAKALAMRGEENIKK